MERPKTKDELLERMAAGRAEWEAALSQVPLEAMEEPGVDGTWSLKDILAHITGYQQYAAAMLADQKIGQNDQTTFLDAYYQQHLNMYRAKHPEFPEQVQKVGPQQVNELFVASCRFKSPSEVRTMEAQSYQKLVQGVEAYTTEELAAPFTSNGKSLLELVPNQCYAHYTLHIPPILEWVAKRSA